MSKNKLEKFAEMERFGHVVQAPYNKVGQTDFYLKGKWAKDFFKNQNPIVVELGCGKGEYSVALAEQNPGANYIGVDIKGARLYNGAKEAADKGLENVAFLRTNIEIIQHFFGPEEISEIWLTFPDPQMKKTRKRLTSTAFLERYRPFLKNGGLVHLKTDSNFQFTYTREMVRENGFQVAAETDDLYATKMVDPVLQIKTFYEKQWLARGIAIKYIAFKLHGGKLAEPDMEIEKDEYRSFGRSARDIH